MIQNSIKTNNSPLTLPVKKKVTQHDMLHFSARPAPDKFDSHFRSWPNNQPAGFRMKAKMRHFGWVTFGFMKNRKKVKKKMEIITFRFAPEREEWQMWDSSALR